MRKHRGLLTMEDAVATHRPPVLITTTVAHLCDVFKLVGFSFSSSVTRKGSVFSGARISDVDMAAPFFSSSIRVPDALGNDD